MVKNDTEERTLCGASSYQQKYYFNPAFSDLPESVRDELQILCVTFTEEVGGILTLVFDPDGRLEFQVGAAEGDAAFDEIGSALLIKKKQKEKQDLFEKLELYYKMKTEGILS